MKIISVGTNHAGTSFVRTLAKLNKEKNFEIVAYDKNSNISFLGCGIALWVGGEFKDPAGLFYSDKDKLEKMGIKVKMQHEVVSIDEAKKEVLVKNLETGEEFTDNYDKLVFAGGTWPIVPPFPGIDLENIFLSKLFQHAQKIKEKANDSSIKNVVVVGAGYIGVELLEAFTKAGKNVTLIDMADRVIPRYFDPEFTDKMEERMRKAGVKLQLGEKIVEFKGKDGKVKKVITDKGEYNGDLVILSIGFAPQTKMLAGKVDMLPNGAIKVDSRMRSSNPNIYAIGDSAAIHHNVLNDNMHVALATNAVKTGLVAALDVAGAGIDFPGVQGTNAIDVFGCNYSSTGFTESSSKSLGLEAASVFWSGKDREEFMHNAADMQIKFTYHPKTLKLMGAQIGSWDETNHTEVIYALSLAIQKGMTLPEVALMDVFFLPHYNKAFNFMIRPILSVLGLDYDKKD